MNYPKPFILGGAQIGQRYGEFTTGGFLDDADVDAVLAEAWSASFSAVDTASGYGDSEAQIGRAGWPGQLHTKLDSTTPAGVSLERSLERLRREKIDLLYLCHDASQLRKHNIAEWDQILRSLRTRVDTFGLSLYADQLEEKVADLDEIRVLQVPVNVVSDKIPDRILQRWSSLGKTVLARSVFFRGLLINSSLSTNNQFFGRAAAKVHEASVDLGLSRGELSLRWVLGNSFVDGLIIGVSSVQELHRVTEWARKGALGREEMAHVESKVSAERRNFDLRSLN